MRQGGAWDLKLEIWDLKEENPTPGGVAAGKKVMSRSEKARDAVKKSAAPLRCGVTCQVASATSLDQTRITLSA